VLLVEDNCFDVLLFQEAIELYRLPFELHVASDGERACEFIDRAARDPGAARPEILILDLNLPRRSGREVLECARANEAFRGTAVLIVSSSDLSRERDELAQLGASRFFTKPTGYDDFLKVGEILKELSESDSVGRASPAGPL
jgi:CheY-like chemotaxis protein